MALIFTNNTYPIKHWVTSLVVGPLIEYVYSLFHTSYINLGADIISIYVLYLVFGLAFSIPVFVFYLLIFNALIKTTQSEIIIKTILNLMTIISVFIIIKSIGGTAMTTSLCISYSIGIIFSSLFYKIKKQNSADT